MNTIMELPYSDDIKNKLNYLVSLVLDSDIECKKIVLFGSYARMEQKINSDLDIFILSDNQISREQRGYLASVFEENNADIVFCTTSIFDTSDNLLYRNIRKDGVLLWKV